ncbi:hypothetical protein [Mycolicibacterium palauense]|uniref:hypothetical protein n=1 Tax=Mycolicibacterium palauense TaxID=2034511 RepID=UPI00159BBCE1|nr:hypothetical protein [Mycolicibacterium palauense]
MPRSSPWLDDRARLLVRLLAEKHGLDVSESTALECVAGHVDLVAERMRIGRQAAKLYVTDDVIERVAGRIAQAVSREIARQSLESEEDVAYLRLVRPDDRGDIGDVST